MQARVEIEKAVEWLCGEFLPAEPPSSAAATNAAALTSESRAKFRDCIKRALSEQYEGHWYPEEPHRGCAYRSLSCNGSLDPLLDRVLRECKIDHTQLQPKEHFILWVNPGEVKVNDAGSKRHIFCADAKPNPYSKPKVHLEPTRLNVATEEPVSRTESSADSSASSTPTGSPKPTPKLSPAAAKFVPRTGLPASSQSSDTSDSEGEQEARPGPRPPPGPPPPQTFMPGQQGLFMANWQMPPQANNWPMTVAGAWQPAPPHGAYAVPAH